MTTQHCMNRKHSRTCDRKVVGSTPSQVAIKWLVPGWVTVLAGDAP